MGRLPVSAMIAVLLILSAAGRPGFAQSNIEANAGIQFDFSNPGARSRAMGGAFLGLSDDATAALANPAGLTQLAAPEFSFEGRASDFTTVLPFESDKRFDGTVINRDFTSGVNSPSFQSFVFAGNRPWSVAIYRTELVNFESSGSSLGPYTQSGRRARPFETQSAIGVTQYGVAGAYNVGDTVSLGFAVTFTSAKVDVRTYRYTTFLNSASTCTDNGLLPLTACEQGTFSTAEVDQLTYDDDSLLPITFNRGDPNSTRLAADRVGEEDAAIDIGDLANFQTQIGDDAAVGYTLGMRWHTPDETFSFGATFKSGTEFDVRVQNVNPVDGLPFTSLGDEGAARPRYLSNEISKFKVPARFGVGVAWKGENGLTLAFDYSRVNYSALSEDLAIMFFKSRVEDAATGADIGNDAALAAQEAFQVNDGNEIRAGLEWGVPVGPNLFFLRGGVWLDPDHQLKFDDTNVNFIDDESRDFLQEFSREIVFPGIDDQMHYTVGAGLAVGARLQVDVAYDYSELISSTNASVVIRF